MAIFNLCNLGSITMNMPNRFISTSQGWVKIDNKVFLERCNIYVWIVDTSVINIWCPVKIRVSITYIPNSVTCKDFDVRFLIFVTRSCFNPLPDNKIFPVVISIFSFQQNFFYPSQNKFLHTSHIYFVICKCFHFGLMYIVTW